MQELKIFKNEKFGEVRTLMINDEPYFVGKDVAKILGYKETANMRKIIDEVDYTEIKPQNIENTGFVQNGSVLEPNKNVKRMLLINESGLYQAIFGSTLPQAKEFKRWVTHEVLPSIRKHGIYATDELLNNPDFLIEALTKLKEEREKRIALEIDNNIKAQQIGELKPKADYVDKILNCKSLVTVSQIAKDYGMSAIKFNNILHDLRVQYKQTGQWLLYSKYHHKGYTHSETYSFTGADGVTNTKLTTKWTNKGRLFLYNLLKDSGYLPLIEME